MFLPSFFVFIVVPSLFLFLSMTIVRVQSAAFLPGLATKGFVSSTPQRLWGRRGSGSGGASKKKATIKKQNLPSKTCVVCGRPFTWRKKWERCWDEVTCCSKACNAERRRNKGGNSSEKDDDVDYE